jgi:GTP cyclohydrolase I
MTAGVLKDELIKHIEKELGLKASQIDLKTRYMQATSKRVEESYRFTYDGVTYTFEIIKDMSERKIQIFETRRSCVEYNFE